MLPVIRGDRRRGPLPMNRSGGDDGHSDAGAGNRAVRAGGPDRVRAGAAVTAATIGAGLATADLAGLVLGGAVVAALAVYLVVVLVHPDR